MGDCASRVSSCSNGNGFDNIEVGDFQAALIQAQDGVFVSNLSISLLVDRYLSNFLR